MQIREWKRLCTFLWERRVPRIPCQSNIQLMYRYQTHCLYSRFRSHFLTYTFGVWPDLARESLVPFWLSAQGLTRIEQVNSRECVSHHDGSSSTIGNNGSSGWIYLFTLVLRSGRLGATDLMFFTYNTHTYTRSPISLTCTALSIFVSYMLHNNKNIHAHARYTFNCWPLARKWMYWRELLTRN